MYCHNGKACMSEVGTERLWVGTGVWSSRGGREVGESPCVGGYIVTRGGRYGILKHTQPLNNNSTTTTAKGATDTRTCLSGDCVVALVAVARGPYSCPKSSTAASALSSYRPPTDPRDCVVVVVAVVVGPLLRGRGAYAPKPFPPPPAAVAAAAAVAVAGRRGCAIGDVVY